MSTSTWPLEDKEYTLLEAAEKVLAHVEDESLGRIDSSCTLCFSYRKMLRKAIAQHKTPQGYEMLLTELSNSETQYDAAERAVKAINALKESAEFWRKASDFEHERAVGLKVLEDRVVELERQLSRTFI